jgi:lysophospholipase L1-like esterase
LAAIHDPIHDAVHDPIHDETSTASVRHFGLIALVVALVVSLGAETAVRVAEPLLKVPQWWPTPETEAKADQMAAERLGPHKVAVVLSGASMMDAGGDGDALAALIQPQRNGGARVYNGALAGTALEALLPWTERVLVPRLRPAAVVFGLSSIELNGNEPGTATATAAFLASRPMRQAMGQEDPIDRADRWAREWSALYRYRGVLRRPLDAGRPPAPQGLDMLLNPPLSTSGQALTFAANAYLTFDGKPVTLRQLSGNFTGQLLFKWQIGPTKVRQLTDSIDRLRAAGIRVVVLALPVTRDFVSFHPHGASDYDAGVAQLRRIADSTCSRFVDAGVWPTKYFGDPIHLNSTGARLLATVLAPAVRGTAAA